MKRGGTTDKFTAYGRQLNKQMAVLRGKPYVKVGILERDYDVEKKGPDGPAASAGSWPRTNGAVGVYNEFGTSTIPERSFIRWTHDNRKDSWRKLQGELRPHVIAGRMTIGKALGVIGARIQGDIQQRISSNVPPPNAPSTIAAKARGSGSATTLINYGQLRGTVHFAVVNAH